MSQEFYTGRNVIETRACNGLGLAMAKHLATQGANSAVSSKSDRFRLERPVKRLAAASFRWPKWVERGLAKFRDEAVEKMSVKTRPWRLFQVESSFACNLRCLMCPWKQISKSAADNGIMSPEIWAAIRPHLPDVTSVDFTGGGEPLLQPRLAEWIGEATAAGCETGFLSNGLLLTKERLQKILDAGVDWICISMDGATAEMYNKIRVGSSFERVCKNVSRLTELRDGHIPKIMINFVLMGLNIHQVEDMIRLASRLGVDQVNFKQCDVIRGEHGKGLGLFGREQTKEIRKLEKALSKAQRLAKKMNILTTAFPFTPNELPVCDQDPRDSLFIRYDGIVAPCINLAIGGPTTFIGQDVTMPSVHYGKLPEDSLTDLWERPPCKFYRKRFQERDQVYDNVIVKTLVGSSGSNRERALQRAREAMPDPPQGCHVCHYLYDI